MPVATLRETERALVAVLLTEPRSIIPVAGILKQPEDIADSLCRESYRTIIQLAHNQKVPNVYTVANAAKGVTLEALNELVSLANPRLAQEVKALANVIAQEATYRRVQDTAQQLATTAAARPADLPAFVYESMQALGDAVQGRSDRPSDLGTIGQEVDRLIADESGLVGIPTGLQWLTNRIGGFLPGDIVGIIAVYKQRKSTLARNLVLAAARKQRNVAVYLLEGNRQTFYMDLWSMLATEYLYTHYDTLTYQQEANLDALHLAKRLRTPLQHEALEATRPELQALEPYLHIADGKDGIGHLSVFEARLRRDRFLFGTEIYFLDHLQLMDTGSSEIFKNVSATVKVCQNFSVAEGVTAVILSQKNEASVDDDDSSYSPGVKGGGDLAAACDHVLVTKYDSEQAPLILDVRLKMSRRAAKGHRLYAINETAGLIVGEAKEQTGPTKRGAGARRPVEEPEEN